MKTEGGDVPEISCPAGADANGSMADVSSFKYAPLLIIG
jgi:hypothetical protein